jgi:hypothetical protein
MSASMVPVSDPAKAPADDPADLAALERYAAELLQAVEVALPAWVQRAVLERWAAWSGAEPSPELAEAARDAADAAADAVLPDLRALLAQDVAAQRSNPLSLVRRAVVPATAVLAAAGVPHVVRDADAARLFPDDVYDLTPASFADLDPAALEPGLRWGAAKAHVLLRRRRAEG